jgi:hypothetical protein
VRIAARVALAAIGVGAIAALVHDAGANEVLEAASAAQTATALAFALEASRIVFEAYATRALLRGNAARLPRRTFVRAHLASYAIATIMPAGRAAAEAAKAATFAPYVGGDTAAAVAVRLQALHLLAGALIAVPCAVAAVATTGGSALAVALGIQAALLAAMGLAVIAISRSRWVADRLGRIRRFREPIARFRAAAEALPGILGSGYAFLLLSRVVQVIAVVVLARGVGLGDSIGHGLAAFGLQSAATSAGDLVPAQVGVTEGAFRWASELFGATAAKALTVAILVHAVQLACAGLSSLAALVPVRDGNDVPKTKGTATPDASAIP